MSETVTLQSTTLGVTLHDGGGTFRLYSANATAVRFVLVDPSEPKTELQVLDCSRVDGDIWEVSSSLIIVGVHYTVQVEGPESAQSGFNPEVDLIDPYARGVVREGPRDFHNVVIDRSFDWQGVTKPNTPLSQTVIYEAHARGLTRGNLTLPDELRGTYAALAHSSTIAHLKKIGVTAVELLPVQMFISEPRLMNMGLINYWGYNTINFFTPHHRYATASAIAAGPDAIVREFKTMIRELHRNGIEVIMDVVYNHTAEGGVGGPTLSFKGIDNKAWYRQDNNGNYVDVTGCGNTLAASNPHAVRHIVDSLRWWVEVIGVDGFRFDLATALYTSNSAFNSSLMSAIEADSVLRNFKMIAEPWDISRYSLGDFPHPWREWNDRYRDSVRQFWLGDLARGYGEGVSDIASSISGSSSIFHYRGPTSSINFVAAHDGFTIHDMVTYSHKHNEANLEDNKDGSDSNRSWNVGHEGETHDA